MPVAKTIMVVTVAIAIGCMAGAAQAVSNIYVVQNIDWNGIGQGEDEIIHPLSLFPDFTEGYEDWIVSNTNPDAPIWPDATHPQGPFGIYEEKTGANLFDTDYGSTGGGFDITANGAFASGSHCGVGEPCTYSTFPNGENGTGGAIDRPSLAWTWPTGATWIKLQFKINIDQDMTLEYYHNHGTAGYTHHWVCEHYAGDGTLKDTDTLDVTSPRFAEIQINIDFTDVQQDDYFLVSLQGADPTFHAAGLKLAGPCFIAGDLDHDGDVDIFDWAIFQPNFGATCGTGAQPTVPEPASLALLGLGAAAMAGRRRR
ncbi:MAG: PEP-CTERM sorting domain-containing protein [Planctomycetes bacterium]|nr:PEP-CTERM sorting domain-containing protein [Planctomycetota bacterium]